MSNPNNTRYKIWVMYKRKCFVCGRFMKLEDVTKDHVIPKSKGGMNRIQNYAPAHALCNMKKSSKVTERHIAYSKKIVKESGIKHSSDWPIEKKQKSLAKMERKLVQKLERFELLKNFDNVQKKTVLKWERLIEARRMAILRMKKDIDDDIHVQKLLSTPAV